MTTKTFSADGTQNFALDAKCEIGYRVLSYSGDLGGGTLRVKTKAADAGDLVYVPNAKLSATTDDANGDTAFQVVFQSSGQVHVELSGATDPDCTVSVE